MSIPMSSAALATLSALAGGTLAILVLRLTRDAADPSPPGPSSQATVAPDASLDGRVVVVTGASSGIGRAIALCAASKGAHVLIVDLRDTPLEGGTPTVTADASVIFLRANVSRRADVEATVAEAVRRWGRLDVWINNAALDLTDPPHECVQRLLDVTDEQWARVHAVNTTGYFLGAQAAVAQFLKQEPSVATGLRGKLINIASQHGIVACPGNLPYGTSKAAANYMTKQIAVDYAEHAVACNAVAPGKIVKDAARPVASYSRQRTPCQRLGVPEDVASAVCWLASDEAGAFVTGATLMVDGGWTAY